MKLRTTHYILGIAGLAIVALVAFGATQKNRPGPADDLARCLTEKGAVMYGAYWCPHCQNQKKLFGNSWQYVNYVECALPGGRGQTQECTDAGITGYPTWVFRGGERKSGEQSFSTLADAAGCAYTEDGGETPAPASASMDADGTAAPNITAPAAAPVSE